MVKDLQTSAKDETLKDETSTPVKPVTEKLEVAKPAVVGVVIDTRNKAAVGRGGSYIINDDGVLIKVS